MSVSRRIATLLVGSCLVAAPAAAQDAGAPDAGVPPDTQAAPPPPSEPLPMPAPGQTLADVPPPAWAADTGGPEPSFLDTTDRRITDERPPPTPEQVAALREMEAELARFSRTGDAFRESVNSILMREYQRRRRERQAGYARQIRIEERLQHEARLRAIRLFEAFIARYPTDPTYTPDAMFRLGELYYERSALAFQDAMDSGEPPASGHPDYTPTIELYRTLIQRFPDYRRIDGAYYLIGYCLNEMGEMERARLAWLNLVCANHFEFTPEPPAPEGEEPAEDPAEEHPALGLDPAPSEPDGPFVDPYDGCTPVIPSARFVMEVWLRLGEYHFDFDFEPHALDRAISAYNKVLADPTDRNYNLALYKVAWAYYRASRYPEAIEHFGMLIEFSDEQLRRTGRAGSDLRAEAVTYLGIAFAYDDWNENQIPDDAEGSQTPIQRIQDPALLPQDRPWTSEIYFELGKVLYEEAKYPQAVEVWELALSRWPNHPQAPEVTANIARAWQRQQEMERALAAQERLSDYREGSEWWENNMDNPVEQRRAEELAEGALIHEATRHHQEAQRLRREAIEEQSVEKLDLAMAEYNLAAAAYRGYLEAYPNSPNAYELQYNLADALFWSEQYEEAARVYASVRDSNLDDTFLSESARRVVESLHRLVQAAEERGELNVRNDPETEVPEPTGTPPRVQPIEMPMLVQRLAQSREIYLARVPESQDSERVRAPYDYNNALLLYYYGYWPQARERFLRIYNERCSGEMANETGRVAWESLYNMAVRMDDTAEAERLALDLQQRGCSFTADGPVFTNEEEREAYCEDPEHRAEPICTAGAVLTDVRYARAVEVFDRAEAAEGEQQRELYEQSATMLVDAVNDEPNHPQAPVALLKAGIALERTQRFDSAGRIYQRVIDEVGPQLAAADGERETELEGILATAYFRLAFTANRFFDYERAIQNYLAIADSDTFQSSDDPEMPQRITDSLINAARILEFQQDYRRAARYYERAADRLTDPNEKRSAHFRIAEMAFKSEDWGDAVGEMQEFINRYGNDRAAVELVTLASWRIAQAREEQRNASRHRAALQDTVDVYDRLGGQPGSMAAEYAANSRFLIVDPELEELEDLEIDPGRQPTLEAFVNELNRQIQSGSQDAQTVADGYEPIMAYRRPVWSIAALTRQGRAYEILARAVLNAEITMPTDIQRQLRGASPDVRDELQWQLEDRVRQVLDSQVRPIECFAVVRYALAARAAQAGNIDSEHSREAIDRLQAYGDERIAQCIAEGQQQDATLQAYRPDEFDRARRGRYIELTPGVSAPPLAREND